MESPLDALQDAEAARQELAAQVTVPRGCFAWLGAAITVQLATTATGVADGAPLVLVSGLVVFAAVATVLLLRFRRLNGVWLGGFASRVVLGTGNGASASYAAALALAVWSAYAAGWWLAALWAAAGGAAYAFSGTRWLRAYRAAPAEHARGESAFWLALLVLAALAGLAGLVVNA